MLSIIPESNVCRLIIESKLPATESFEASIMENFSPPMAACG